jgi:Tol biopolymer transport system component
VGSFPSFVAPDLLVFLRDSTLYSASFDPKALRLTGEPAAVLTGIRREALGSAHLAIANDGTMVWASGGDGTAGRFVWVGQDGRVQDTLFLPPSEVLSYALSHDGRRLAIQHALPRGRQSLVIADLLRRVVDSVAYAGEISPINWIRSDRALTIASSRWRGVLDVAGADFRIDSTGRGFQDEAPATRLQCFAGNRSTRVWSAGSRTDSVVLQNGPGGWCRFSPDGRWLAWKGVNPGGIFLAPADSLGARDRLQVGPDGGDEPRWSRDGRDIIYRMASQWYAVRVPDRRGADAAQPRLLLQGHYLQAVESWDLGPDGRFLLLQGLPPVQARTLRVVTGLPGLIRGKRGATHQ